MDTPTFCEMLRTARKLSGVSVTEAAYKTGKSTAALNFMFSCKNIPTAKSVCDFLVAINCTLDTEGTDNRQHTFQEFDALSRWMIAEISSMSVEECAVFLEVTRQTVSRVKRGENFKISLLLTLCAKKDYTVTIQPKDILRESADDCDVDF